MDEFDDIENVTPISTAEAIDKFSNLEEQINSYYQKFIKRLNLTKGARYECARRHQKRSMASIWAITALSLYVFTTNVLLVLFGAALSENLVAALGVGTIVMSAFIIAFSVMEYGHKHDLKAHLFLKNAQAIHAIHDKATYQHDTGIADRLSLEVLRSEYDFIVNTFEDNHSEVDFLRFRINIGKYNDKPILRRRHALAYFWNCWAIMVISMTVPPLALFISSFFFDFIETVPS